MTFKRGRIAGAPFAIQVVALLIAGLVFVQLVNLAIVLLAPLPRPAVYHLDEVAGALEGRGLQTRFGRPLLRTRAASPPQEGQPSPGGQANLARLMGLPQDHVRLSLSEPPFWFVLTHHSPEHRRDPSMAPSLNETSERRDEFGPGPSQETGANGPGRELFPSFDPARLPIFGQFVAAVLEPSGTWVVVRPADEPFPNGWQSRIIVSFIACVLVFAVAGYLFARRMTAPIGAFAAAADRLGRDPRAPLLALRGPAELGVAARAFNEMQIRIKRYVEDRTAMVGAISHDLRTPLTRIRFKMEAADPALRDAVITDVAQMEAMISAVLVFIRDANAPARRERLDLLSLLECEVDAAALIGADVTMEPGQTVTIAADPVGLKRLFGNLIDNAVKYGGGARVKLRVEGDEAVIEVADEGPGLPETELQRVFEPFHRAEPSRNPESGGVGLGLSVARSIARAHGGDIVLSPRAEGLAAVVRLPLPKAE